MNTAYYILLVLAILVSLTLGLMSWRKRPNMGANSIFIMMVCSSFWIFCELMYLLTNTYHLKMFWYIFKYIGIVSVPVAWFVLAFQYYMSNSQLTKKWIVLLMIVPSITIIMAFTNTWHGLFLDNFVLEVYENMTLIKSRGQIFYWINVLYSYSLILVGTVLISASYFKLSNIYKRQTRILIIGASIPYIANILYNFEIIDFPLSDITPIAILFSGLIFFRGFFRHKLLDIVPIARDTIIENMRDLLIVLDNQKRIIDMNQAAIDVLKMSPLKSIGQPFSNCISKFPLLLQKIYDDIEIKEKIVIENGSSNYFYDLSTSLLYDKKGMVSGELIVLRDITELEVAMNEINESKKAAESASTAKSQFLANMSHEIRTPMNSVVGMTDLLITTDLDGEQKRYADILKDSAESLLLIINDILDFSKIEAGKLEIESIDFNLIELVTNIITENEEHAHKKKLILALKIDQDIPKGVIGDSVRIAQILNKLVSNAIKFTDSGIIELDVSLVSKEDDFIKICFSVTDTGIGIPSENINNLFESFNQLDSSTTRKVGGTGLGLSIVKRLVKALSGSITVESELGKGSRFIVVIPFVLSHKDFEEEKEKNILGEEEKKFERGIHVLLAEDNKINQMLMIRLFEKGGYDVDVADNGKMVLEMMSYKEYDIILMDIQMPELDGYETTEIIRNEEKNTRGHIPIIALTAGAMQEDKDRCMKAGMDDYISKPVKSQKLFSLLNKYV